jgi:hypothetical protein
LRLARRSYRPALASLVWSWSEQPLSPAVLLLPVWLRSAQLLSSRLVPLWLAPAELLLPEAGQRVGSSPAERWHFRQLQIGLPQRRLPQCEPSTFRISPVDH